MVRQSADTPREGYFKQGSGMHSKNPALGPFDVSRTILLVSVDAEELQDSGRRPVRSTRFLMRTSVGITNGVYPVTLPTSVFAVSRPCSTGPASRAFCARCARWRLWRLWRGAAFLTRAPMSSSIPKKTQAVCCAPFGIRQKRLRRHDGVNRMECLTRGSARWRGIHGKTR